MMAPARPAVAAPANPPPPPELGFATGVFGGAPLAPDLLSDDGLLADDPGADAAVFGSVEPGLALDWFAFGFALELLVSTGLPAGAGLVAGFGPAGPLPSVAAAGFESLVLTGLLSITGASRGRSRLGVAPDRLPDGVFCADFPSLLALEVFLSSLMSISFPCCRGGTLINLTDYSPVKPVWLGSFCSNPNGLAHLIR